MMFVRRIAVPPRKYDALKPRTGIQTRDYNIPMSCPDKVMLQQKCAAAWDAYTDAAAQAGLVVDPQGFLRAPSISELVARSIFDAVSPYSTPLRMRGEHLKASMELSRHLSGHRC
jgi:hypothetical protein